MWLWVQPRTHKWAIAGRYEPELYSAIKAHLPPTGVFWDIGAHIGLVAVPIAARGAAVVAVEPLPTNVERLRKAIGRNRLENVEIVPVAVGESHRKVKITEGESSTGRVADDGVEVTMITLDMLLEDHQPPDLVKIDVEGFENDVLAGAERLLQRRSSTLIIELHAWADNALTCTTLREAAYSLEEISPQHIVASPR